MSVLFYLNNIYIPFYLILLLGSIVLAIISYRRVSDILPKVWLILLIILRAILFFLIFSALFFLVMELRFRMVKKPYVSILLDTSGSMDIKEEKITRKQEGLQFVHKKLMPLLSKKANIEFFLFSDKIYPPQDSLQVKKGMTMIGEVLKHISQYGKREPSAVFLISDGRNTSGMNPIPLAEKLPYTIFTVPVGKVTKENNLKIESIRVNPIVYKGDSVPVTIILSNSGSSRENVEVQLRKNGKIVSKHQIKNLKQGINYPVQLTFVPMQTGVVNFNVVCNRYEDETNTVDNSDNFSVKVMKKRKTATLLAYQPNWDYKFILDFLTSQDYLETAGYARIADNKFYVQKLNKEKIGSLNPEEILLSEIIILLNPAPMERNLFFEIENRVSEKGAGLLIIGNKLPDFPEFRKLYPFVVSGKELSADIEPVLTEEGERSALFRINGRTISFPPVSNPLKVKMAKAQAKVYLQGHIKQGATVPLFGSINYGRGKVAAFTAENIWHWKMLQQSKDDNGEIFTNIMNNILKWLPIRKEEERVVLNIKKTRLLWGESLNIHASLYDEMMNPIEGGIINLHLKKDDKKLSDLLMKDVGAGNYEKIIPLLAPGNYSINAEVKFPQDIQARPSANVSIEPQPIENLDTQPNHLLLNNIARATGGEILNPETPLSELENLKLKPQIIFHKKRLNFSNSLFVLLAASIIFIVEIYLRKRKGLK
jgi:hypothetical protein